MSDISDNKAQDSAEKHSAFALINCYCREIAVPNSLLHITCKPTGTNFQLRIDLPYIRYQLTIDIQRPSLTCNFNYLSEASMVTSDSSSEYIRLGWDKIPVLIVDELCNRYNSHSVRTDLLGQINNSCAQIYDIICFYHDNATTMHGLDAGVYDYIQSEAELVFGHTFHPAPKCRKGFTREDMFRYCPEFGNKFQLHYFALEPKLEWRLQAYEIDARHLVETMAGIVPQSYPQGWRLIPCHPWQAGYLLTQEPVRQAIKDNHLCWLGASGMEFQATASVRTLYSPNFPFFVKLSLSLRITNSVRKNAYYELESAVAISSQLQPTLNQLQKKFKDFSLLLEPMALSVDLPQPDTALQLDLRSHFGVIFRDALPKNTQQSAAYLLAGTVFGDSVTGESNILPLVQQWVRSKSNSLKEHLLMEWFGRYLQHLVPPLLTAYFKFGIAFEPHLQNVVIKMQSGCPAGIVLRDLEGTKLSRSMWPEERFDSVGERALSSMIHDEEKNWRRLSYCLFVNNISQAIFHIGRYGPSETLLWSIVRQTLKQYLDAYPHHSSEHILGELLNGSLIQGKANLITRFFQQADSEASYIAIPNPMIQVHEEVNIYE